MGKNNLFLDKKIYNDILINNGFIKKSTNTYIKGSNIIKVKDNLFILNDIYTFDNPITAVKYADEKNDSF